MAFLLSIWVLEYYLRLNTERHNMHQFEISEFSVDFSNLPVMDEEYSLEILRSELQDLVINEINEQEHIVDRLDESERSTEIVSIYIASLRYKSLEHITKM